MLVLFLDGLHFGEWFDPSLYLNAGEVPPALVAEYESLLKRVRQVGMHALARVHACLDGWTDGRTDGL
eukprot:6194538-Pleurochrysis_carterae.AAC.1